MSSYKDILKSFSIVGSAQIVNIVIGILRTKLFAVFLGPTGVGLLGLFQSIVDIIKNVTGLGLNVSAVKFVAEANAEKDNELVSAIIAILKKWGIITGLAGTIITISLNAPLSEFTFGNSLYRFPRIAGNVAFCSSFCLGIFAWFPHYNSNGVFWGTKFCCLCNYH